MEPPSSCNTNVSPNAISRASVCRLHLRQHRCASSIRILCHAELVFLGDRRTCFRARQPGDVRHLGRVPGPGSPALLCNRDGRPIAACARIPTFCGGGDLAAKWPARPGALPPLPQPDRCEAGHSDYRRAALCAGCRHSRRLGTGPWHGRGHRCGHALDFRHVGQCARSLRTHFRQRLSA